MAQLGKERTVVPNEAVLYYTHLFNPMVRAEMARLQAELPDVTHLGIGYLKDNMASPEDWVLGHAIYRRSDLSALPYPMKLSMSDWVDTSGGNDLPALAFYREN